jgi:hypothetical protein
MSGIHAFMTNQMKADLRACGFSEEQLHDLTPQEGDAILSAANVVMPDSDEVRKFIEIIVAQARAATKHLKEPGQLQVSLIHPSSENVSGVYRYALDNPKLVEQMTKEVVSASESGHNTYLEARTIRRGLRGNKRGEAEDSIAVFASVVDSDADKGEAWTPNVPVSLSVETSPGNEHSWLFWERALDFKTGQEFGARLRAATKTDKPTGNITQPYRIGGTVNYANDKKKQRGRVDVPTRILNFDTKMLWTPEKFEQQYPKSTGGGPTEEGGEQQAPIWRIAKALAVIPHNDNDPHAADYWKQIGHTPGRTYMIQIGLAVKAASGGSVEAFEAFDKWRQGAPDYNADTTKKKWNGFHPRKTGKKIGFGTLKFYADKARPGWEDSDDPALTAEVERLAKLSPADYERERKAAAKKLGMRTTFLDPLVFKARARGKPKPTPKPGAMRDYMKSDCDLACNVGNILLALKQEPMLKNAFGYDEMARAEMLMRPLFTKDPNFKPRPATDADITAVQAWLQWYKFPGLGKDATHDAVNKHARDHAFHPVRNYLDGLVWDGWPRLPTWLSVYFGAKENKYTGAIGTMFLIGMVARIYAPGCKFDYMASLEGGQGFYKSRACSILAGPEYFSDQLPDIKGKEVSQHLRGKWLIEIPELNTYSRSQVDDFKTFLARQVERYRPPYGRKEVHEPRQCAFIGTTNKSGYLRDETGNRRFWPVTTGMINLDKLYDDRDQLFAEAGKLYRDKEQWWPDREFEQEYIAPEQENRYEPDAWEPLIADYLDGKSKTTLIDIAVDTLGYEIEPPQVSQFGPQEPRKTPINRLGPKEQGRIIAVLRHLGWEPKRNMVERWWEPGPKA